MPKTHAERNARWRQTQADKTNALLDEVNTKRARLNLPKFSLEIPRPSLKGKPRHDYRPPTEMAEEELKQWKTKQRMMRKAESQRLNRKKKAALIKSLKEQLAILDEAIERQKKGEVINSEIIDEATVIKECVDGEQKMKDTVGAPFKTAEPDQAISAGDDNEEAQEQDMPTIDPLIEFIEEYLDIDQKMKDTVGASFKIAELDELTLAISAEDHNKDAKEQEVLVVDPLIELREIHAVHGIDAQSWTRADSAIHEAFFDIPIPSNIEGSMTAVGDIDEGQFEMPLCF